MSDSILRMLQRAVSTFLPGKWVLFLTLWGAESTGRMFLGQQPPRANEEKWRPGFALLNVSVVLIPRYFIKSRMLLCIFMQGQEYGKWEGGFFNCSLRKALEKGWKTWI